MSLNWRTYDNWQKAGYQVLAGEKSTKRDKQGRAIFHIDQVASFLDLSDEYYDDIDFYEFCDRD